MNKKKKRISVQRRSGYGLARLDYLAMNLDAEMIQKICSQLMNSTLYIFSLAEKEMDNCQQYVEEIKYFDGVIGIKPHNKMFCEILTCILQNCPEALWIAESNETNLITKLESYPSDFDSLCMCNHFTSILHYWTDENSLVYTVRASNPVHYIELF